MSIFVPHFWRYRILFFFIALTFSISARLAKRIAVYGNPQFLLSLPFFFRVLFFRRIHASLGSSIPRPNFVRFTTVDRIFFHSSFFFFPLFGRALFADVHLAHLHNVCMLRTATRFGVINM